ncbi:hypothetical protein BAE44_0023519 [Dichanthelium oligosanthes]|uniref:Knottins-like domain-containing protein n=1 Tax=Dichanthelium oligosanthes TaxID=888268 RepID=A0A1E5URH5_9POAL|nr:hypothetical protein BAE44_0023519 [Dichanthelium oligosanthes]
MELQPCKIAAAVALIVMLLLTIGGEGLKQASAGNNGDVCSVVYRSKTFEGACVSKPPCVAACGGDGYPDGYCFLDVADPDHRVCMCTGPCPPEAATSRGSTV